VIDLTDDDESMARSMADAIYSAACEDLDDATTKEEADRLYDRCLAEARRMIADPDYMGFGIIKQGVTSLGCDATSSTAQFALNQNH